MINKNTLDKLTKTGNKQKKVVRRYTSKKTGKAVNKEYMYSSSKLLFRKTKNGYKVIENAWKEFEESIKTNASSTAEAQSLINEARTIKQDILNGQKHYVSVTQKGRNRIDVKSMAARLASDTVIKYLYNMGLTPEEVIEYVYDETSLRINETDLVDPGKWHNDNWSGYATDGTPINLTIKFDYTGADHIKINSINNSDLNDPDEAIFYTQKFNKARVDLENALVKIYNQSPAAFRVALNDLIKDLPNYDSAAQRLVVLSILNIMYKTGQIDLAEYSKQYQQLKAGKNTNLNIIAKK